MNLNDLKDKRVMHVDTSCKLHENVDTGIAFKMIKTNEHKGFGLSLKLKRELERDLYADIDRARLYAICIYYIIKEDLDLFDILVICGDEDPELVKDYLSILFENERKYGEKTVISVSELRRITGNKTIKSYAHGVANSYRRRARKSLVRQQKGTPLRVVPINYSLIYTKWMELERKKV